MCAWVCVVGWVGGWVGECACVDVCLCECGWVGGYDSGCVYDVIVSTHKVSLSVWKVGAEGDYKHM